MDKKRKPLQDHRDSSDAKKPRIGNDYKNAPLPTYEQRLNAKETDPHRLQTRQSQIDKGYNTEGYRRYTEAVPKEKRERRNPLHPNTPDKNQVRKWRRLLHQWDVPVVKGEMVLSNEDLEDLASLLDEEQ